MQQGELEADDLGLLMASAAGFAPQGQLAFLVHEVDGNEEATSLGARQSSCPAKMNVVLPAILIDAVQ